MSFKPGSETATLATGGHAETTVVTGSDNAVRMVKSVVVINNHSGSLDCVLRLKKASLILATGTLTIGSGASVAWDLAGGHLHVLVLPDSTYSVTADLSGSPSQTSYATAQYADHG